VGREPLGLSGDVAVVTDVIDFQAETAPDADTAEVKLRLSVQLVREQDIRILASRTFTATAPSASLDNADVVAAFDAASDSMMRDITDWIVGGLR
jgi:cholesterol transport system auxiliary component